MKSDGCSNFEVLFFVETQPEGKKKQIPDEFKLLFISFVLKMERNSELNNNMFLLEW